jgi:hypothetical protein
VLGSIFGIDFAGIFGVIRARILANSEVQILGYELS